jgi:hypothetical protein
VHLVEVDVIDLQALERVVERVAQVAAREAEAPTATKRSSCACEPASSVSLPNVIVPSAKLDTTQPLRPRFRYSMRLRVPDGAERGDAVGLERRDEAGGRSLVGDDEDRLGVEVAHRLARERDQVGLPALGRVPDQGVGCAATTSSTSASP